MADGSLCFQIFKNESASFGKRQMLEFNVVVICSDGGNVCVDVQRRNVDVRWIEAAVFRYRFR